MLHLYGESEHLAKNDGLNNGTCETRLSFLGGQQANFQHGMQAGWRWPNTTSEAFRVATPKLSWYSISIAQHAQRYLRWKRT